MDYLKNLTYLFVPFKVKQEEGESARDQFLKTQEKITNSTQWRFQPDEFKYFLKYFSSKFDKNGNKSCYSHWVFQDDPEKPVYLNQWFLTEHKFPGEKSGFSFVLDQIHLYMFDTAIGMLAFQIHFDRDDAYYIASANYYLKKIFRESLFMKETGAKKNFKDLTNYVMQDLIQGDSDRFQYFFYAGEGTERANFFTYLEVPDIPEEEALKRLYYMRNGYKQTYSYSPEAAENSEEIHVPAKGTLWGISQEATACMTCYYDNPHSEDFIKNKFFPNFNSQYLFMYVYLLHMKYVLYALITKIAESDMRDLKVLKAYQSELLNYEIYYEYSVITEVKQYQSLYEKTLQIFGLEKMQHDLHDPLGALKQEQENNLIAEKELAEEKQKKRDGKLNIILAMISVLSIFSALVDSYQFIEGFTSGPLGIRKYAQFGCIGVIAIIGAITLYYFLHLVCQQIRMKFFNHKSQD